MTSTESNDVLSASYDAVAATYQEGRALSDAALDVWGAAVHDLLPRDPIVVLDLGAGTGIFTRAWPRWRDCRVVGVEPSGGMRAEATRAGWPSEAALIAGTAQNIPLRASSVDVAWLSTVFHQLRDRRGCIEELHRVVSRGGAVLLRGFFSDRSSVGWLPFFPGADRIRARYPSAADTSFLFAGCGFDPIAAIEVEDRLGVTPSQAASSVRRMRKADTLLGAFTVEEFDQGVAALEANASQEPLTNRLTLLGFVRS